MKVKTIYIFKIKILVFIMNTDKLIVFFSSLKKLKSKKHIYLKKILKVLENLSYLVRVLKSQAFKVIVLKISVYYRRLIFERSKTKPNRLKN